MGEETQSEHYGERDPPHNNKNLYWGVVRGVYPPFKTKLNTIRDPPPSQTQRVLPHRIPREKKTKLTK